MSFSSSMFYLMKRHYASRNAMTKLIALANILIFLLATAVSMYFERIFCRPTDRTLHTADGNSFEDRVVSYLW